MSFSWPAWLLVLLVIPAGLIVIYPVVQRRRSRYTVRFTNLDLLANVVEESPAGGGTCRRRSTCSRWLPW